MFPEICCFLMEFDKEHLGNDLGTGDGSLLSSCSDENTQETSQSSKKKPSSAHHQRQEKIHSRSEHITLQLCRNFFLQRGLSQLLHMFREFLL